MEKIKSDTEKLLDQAKYKLKLLERDGLKSYEEHKEIVLEICKDKLKEDIKYFEELLLNSGKDKKTKVFVTP